MLCLMSRICPPLPLNLTPSLCQAMGNALVIAVALIDFGPGHEAWEYALFAGLMAVFIAFFLWLTKGYKYKDENDAEDEALRKQAVGL